MEFGEIHVQRLNLYVLWTLCSTDEWLLSSILCHARLWVHFELILDLGLQLGLFDL